MKGGISAQSLLQAKAIISDVEFSQLLHSSMTVRSTLTPYSFAKFLAKAFSVLEERIPRDYGIKKSLPLGEHYTEWKRKGGATSKYWPVHALHESIRHHGSRFFLRAIVHGSIATLDDTLGFSDMDLPL